MKKLILLILGIVTAVVGAEIALRILPVPGGVGAAEPDERWPTRRLIPGARTTMSFGWDLRHVTHGAINESGFPAPFPYRDGAKVGAVIGDSYVEGLSTTENGRLAPAIAATMGGKRDSVYNFGVSGTSLPHYLGMARIIGPRYRLDWATFIITDRDFEEGFAPQPGFYSWDKAPALIRYTPSTKHGLIEDLGRNSALYRYLRMNLKFSPQSLLSSGFPDIEGHKSGCPAVALSADDKALIDGWVAAMPTTLHLAPGRIVLTFDVDRTRYNNAAAPVSPCRSRDQLARQRLAETARAAGFRVVDTGPVFAAAFARDHRPFDHAPLDRHWTDYSNKLVAKAVAHALVQ